MSMQIRIKDNIFNYDIYRLETEKVETITKQEVCDKYSLTLALCDFYSDDGLLIEGDLLSGKLITVVQRPGQDAAAWSEGLTWAGAGLAVVGGVVSFFNPLIGVGIMGLGSLASTAGALVQMYGVKTPQQNAPTPGYSLRGSTNLDRPGGNLPIVVGKVNVTGDKAGYPYSTYDVNDDQHIHELICLGYSGYTYDENGNVIPVQVEVEGTELEVGGIRALTAPDYVTETNPNGYIVRIQNSPIDTFADASVDISDEGDDAAPEYYPDRIIENTQMEGLTDDYINITSPKNTVGFAVGIYAPFGYYKTNDKGEREAASFTYFVQYKRHSDPTWVDASPYKVVVSGNMNVAKYRFMIPFGSSYDPATPLAADQYDIRVWREDYSTYYDENDQLRDSSDCVQLVCELFQFQTKGMTIGNGVYGDEPLRYRNVSSVPYPAKYTLLSLQAKATPRVNGYLEQVFTEVQLRCRTYVPTSVNDNLPCTGLMWVCPQDTDVYYETKSLSAGEVWVNPYPCTVYAIASGTMSKGGTTITVGTALVAGDEITAGVSGCSFTRQRPATDTMNNPASVLLYVLTCPQINPRPVPQEMIDWEAFREWWLFCNERGWSVNAFSTENISVVDLASRICAAGRASLRFYSNKYSVYIENQTDIITQMFTPKNAWNMARSKNFEEPINLLKCTFINEDTQCEETRLIYFDIFGEDPDVIRFDNEEDILFNEDAFNSETIELWGVTNPRQVAQLGVYRLYAAKNLLSTYTWECGIESLACTVGDVVYLANDIFLKSVGYGRITDVSYDSNGRITGVYLDENVTIESGRSYGITIRTGAGDFVQKALFASNSGNSQDESQIVLTVDEHASTANYLCFETPLPADSDVMSGNLFMYGDPNEMGKKVLITAIEPNEDRGATITAVDYLPEVFTIDVDQENVPIPEYASPVNALGTGANIAEGAGKWEQEKEGGEVNITEFDTFAPNQESGTQPGNTYTGDTTASMLGADVLGLFTPDTETNIAGTTYMTQSATKGFYIEDINRTFNVSLAAGQMWAAPFDVEIAPGDLTAGEITVNGTTYQSGYSATIQINYGDVVTAGMGGAVFTYGYSQFWAYTDNTLYLNIGGSYNNAYTIQEDTVFSQYMPLVLYINGTKKFDSSDPSYAALVVPHLLDTSTGLTSLSGSINNVHQSALRFRRYGDSVTVVADSVTSLVWNYSSELYGTVDITYKIGNASQTLHIVCNGLAYSGNTRFSEFVLSVTEAIGGGSSYTSYNSTKSLVPDSDSSGRTESTVLGDSAKRFDEGYIDNLYINNGQNVNDVFLSKTVTVLDLSDTDTSQSYSYSHDFSGYTWMIIEFEAPKEAGSSAITNDIVQIRVKIPAAGGSYSGVVSSFNHSTRYYRTFTATQSSVVFDPAYEAGSVSDTVASNTLKASRLLLY